METNNQQSNPNLFTQDGRPITAAMIVEWLQTDQVAMSLLQGYLAACKSGRVAHQGLKIAPFSSAGHTSNNDFA